MQQLTQSFTDHSSSDCRQQYFEILRSAWQLRPAMHAELRPPLLSMLGDADNTIRAQALTFWDSALPKHVGLRLQALLQNSLTDAGSLVCTVNGALLTPLLSPPQPPLLLLFLTLHFVKLICILAVLQVVASTQLFSAWASNHCTPALQSWFSPDSIRTACSCIHLAVKLQHDDAERAVGKAVDPRRCCTATGAAQEPAHLCYCYL